MTLVLPREDKTSDGFGPLRTWRGPKSCVTGQGHYYIQSQSLFLNVLEEQSTCWPPSVSRARTQHTQTAAQKAYAPALPVTLSLTRKSRSKTDTIGSRLSETGVTCYHCVVWRRTLLLSTRVASLKMRGSAHMVACTVPAQTPTVNHSLFNTLHSELCTGMDQTDTGASWKITCQQERSLFPPITQSLGSFHDFLGW